MIIKKTYVDDSYIIMNLTTIEFDKRTRATTLIGKLIDEKDVKRLENMMKYV